MYRLNASTIRNVHFTQIQGSHENRYTCWKRLVFCDLRAGLFTSKKRIKWHIYDFASLAKLVKNISNKLIYGFNSRLLVSWSRCIVK